MKWLHWMALNWQWWPDNATTVTICLFRPVVEYWSVVGTCVCHKHSKHCCLCRLAFSPAVTTALPTHTFLTNPYIYAHPVQWLTHSPKIIIKKTTKSTNIYVCTCQVSHVKARWYVDNCIILLKKCSQCLKVRLIFTDWVQGMYFKVVFLKILASANNADFSPEGP